MSKEEAIKEMRQGNRLLHRSFFHGEWVSSNPKGTIYNFEDGVVCNSCTFWHYRNTEYWQDGWSLYEEQSNTIQKATL